MPGTPRVAITLTQCWHRVPGGTATSVERLVDAMAPSERAELIGVGARGELRRPGSWRRSSPPGTWIPPIPIEQLPLPLPVLYDAWARFGRPTVSSATGPVDLVHLTVPMTPPRDDVPLVATVHDLFPLTHPEWMTPRGAGLMRSGLESIRERARLVMVPTEHVAADCASVGFDPGRVRVVPWGVTPTDPTDDDVARVRRRYGLGGPYVLFVGTLEPRKNLALLFQALVQLSRPGITLALVGPAGWGDPLSGDDAAGVGDVPSPVARLGFVPEADLAALERGAAAFCFPSLAEGFGLPVLEAMAAGAAVITSRGTAVGEVAGHGAHLIDPTDPSDLAGALAAVLDEPGYAGTLRAAGRDRAKEFTWARAAAATLDVYDEARA